MKLEDKRKLCKILDAARDSIQDIEVDDEDVEEGLMDIEISIRKVKSKIRNCDNTDSIGIKVDG